MVNLPRIWIVSLYLSSSLYNKYDLASLYTGRSHNHFVSDLELRSSVYNISATIPNRWYTRYTIEGGIALSLIALAIIFINGATQVGYGLAPQFSLGTFNYTGYPAIGLEPATKAFLEGLQQKGGPPTLYSITREGPCCTI